MPCHVRQVNKDETNHRHSVFKHKYITQPEVKPADVIIKAYNDLKAALQGMKNANDSKQIHALEEIQDQLSPGNKLQIEQQLQCRLPRVESAKQELLTYQPKQQHPRVQFEEPRDADRLPTRMIVASPKETIVASSPSPQQKFILKHPKFTASDSIAERVKARHASQNDNQTTNEPELSIAERVAARRRQKEQANPVLDFDTGELLEYRQLLRHPKYKEIWNRAAANEFGRLAQGVGGRVKATNTIEFIHKHEVPQDRFKDVTYIKLGCNILTKKKDPYQTRATMGGNLINYPDDVGTPTANLLLIKIFLNSVISTDGARFANADLSNFYLMTPLK